MIIVKNNYKLGFLKKKTILSRGLKPNLTLSS